VIQGYQTNEAPQYGAIRGIQTVIPGSRASREPGSIPSSAQFSVDSGFAPLARPE